MLGKLTCLTSLTVNEGLCFLSVYMDLYAAQKEWTVLQLYTCLPRWLSQVTWEASIWGGQLDKLSPTQGKQLHQSKYKALTETMMAG